jgi:two-component system sensor histidine kinase KdpD
MQPAGPNRGKLTVFLGMAAGVGKTYRMLREGHRVAENGRDVVIGYLEPHDRADTIEQASGLETMPRLSADHGLEELDVDAILARRPDICLVDELAHTNAPGLDHEKRWQDVEQITASGIDVFTTMNVQHLESLNDQVAELTGTRVRETVPDKVLQKADEVVLIDLAPETLIGRLQEGKIYPADRVPAALNNFFKIENLRSLRSVALRQVADEVDAKRLTVEQATGERDIDRLKQSAVPLAVGERALALVTPKPSSQRVLRRAWRSAQRLGSELDVLWVAEPDYVASPEEQAQVAALRRLSSVLGAHFLVMHGDDVVETIGRCARERGSTYVLLGPPSPRSAVARWSRPSLMDRLLRELPGIDVRVIADRSKLPARKTEQEESE